MSMKSSVKRMSRRRGAFKQARFIRVHGLLFVLGLEWHETHEKNKRYLRQLAKNSKGSYGTLLSSDQSLRSLFGVVANTKQGRRARSGAAYIANAYTQAVIILPLDESLFWLCAVTDGEVIVGKDIVATQDTIREVANELLLLNPQFLCVGDEQSWLDMGIKHSINSLDIDEVFDKADCAMTPYLEHYGSRRWLWVTVAVTTACLVGIGSHLGYRDWQEKEAIKNNKVNIEKDPRELAIAAHDAAVMSAFTSEGLHHANGLWIRRVLMQLDNTPLSTNGWDLKEVSCEFTVDQCIQTWISTVGSYSDFLSALPIGENPNSVSFIEPKRIEKTVLLSAKQQLLQPLSNRDHIKGFLAALPKQRQFQVNDVSMLQSVGVLDHVTFGVSSMPTLNYPAPPSFNSITPLGHLSVGDWQLEGTDLIILLGSVQLLNDNVFHIHSLTMTLNAGINNDTVSWAIKGRYTTQGNH